MIVSTTNLDDNNGRNKNKTLFTIQYTKEELDKIQNVFLEQLSSYFAKVNITIVVEIRRWNYFHLLILTRNLSRCLILYLNTFQRA